MRCRLSGFGLGLLALSAVACESTPPPTVPTGPAVAEGAGPVKMDVSPVPEPGDVVGVARWKNPAATFAGLAACAGLPPQLADSAARGVLESAFAEALRGQVDAKQLAKLVTLEAPIDAVMTLDGDARRPRAFSAFSIGLASLDGARAAVEPQTPVSEIVPGVFRIGERRGDLVCALAASGGSTPARLVCGGNEKDLKALAPYLARTVPTKPSAGSDVHGELSWLPVDAKFGQKMRLELRGLPIIAQSQSIGDPKFDKALGDAAVGLSDELGKLMSDADKLTFDVGVAPSSCIAVKSTLSLRSRTSWIASILTRSADRTGPPPSIFWRAPKDSESAFYSRGADPAQYAEILRVLRALADGGLAKAGIASAADRKAVTDLLTLPQSKDVNSVQASGHYPAPQTTGEPAKAMEALVNAYIGWHVVGVDDSPDALSAWLKNLVGAYNKKGIQDLLKKQLKSSANLIPTAKLVPAPAALGRGALAVEITFTELLRLASVRMDKPPAIKLHILLMGDGKSTWMALGTDRDDLVKKLLGAKTGAPAGATLAGRPGLEALQNEKHVSAGFTSLSPITTSLATGASSFSALLGGATAAKAAPLAALGSLPNKGATPVVVSFDAAQGGAPRFDMSVNVQKGSIEDLGAVGLALFKLWMSRGANP